MKHTIKIFSIILAFITILVSSGSYNFIANAKSIIGEEQMDDIALLQGNYADNRVLVVLDNETSLLFNEYTPSDFSMINCKTVTNLTQSTSTIVKDYIEKGTTSTTDTMIDTSKYEQILCLELEESGKDKVAAAIKLLQSMDGVKYAEPDYIMTVDSTMPNDPLSQPWDVNSKLQLPQAWDITTGSDSVMVGVLDTGIDGTHPDLAMNLNYSLCRDFTSGSEVPASPTDPYGHGTEVAGIIGAQGNNGQGMCGVCWNVNLVSLRVIDASGDGYTSWAILAIDYATRKNIKLLNMSISWSSADGDFSEKYSASLYNAIANYPGLVVCSAANNNRNNDIIAVYPSGYILDNLISVGASTSSDTRWYANSNDGSNFGKTTVDIFAPGDDLKSCSPGATYCLTGGTSMATPFVTGTAALMLAANPNMKPEHIKNAIMENDDDCSALTDLCVSGGRLNVYKVLSTHVHYYGYSYSPATNRHLSYCNCGAYIWESHIFDPNQTGNIRSCTICGYQVQIQNIYPEHEIE